MIVIDSLWEEFSEMINVAQSEPGGGYPRMVDGVYTDHLFDLHSTKYYIRGVWLIQTHVLPFRDCLCLVFREPRPKWWIEYRFCAPARMTVDPNDPWFSEILANEAIDEVQLVTEMDTMMRMMCVLMQDGTLHYLEVKGTAEKMVKDLHSLPWGGVALKILDWQKEDVA